MFAGDESGVQLGSGGPATTVSPHPPHLGPLAAWLGIQLGLLLLAILQVPLSDQYTRPAEHAALDVMLIGQVLLAAMLFPWLLRSLSAAIIIAAASWPFIQLAMVLSSASAMPTFLAGAYASTWIITLAAWRRLLRSPRAQLAGAAAATLLSAGGALIWYLRAEFVRSSGGAQWGTDALLGPILGILAIAHNQSVIPWLPLAALLLIAVVAQRAGGRQ